MKDITRISQLLSQIIYHQKLYNKYFMVPKTKVTMTFLNFLIAEGLLNGYTLKNEMIEIHLKYDTGGEPVLTIARKISTNRKKVSISRRELERLNSQCGIYILSTQYGFINQASALAMNTGGLLLYYLR